MKSGFTLVELSIVLVIIGLLIGGILVGQSLINSAKINRLVSDIRQYEVATMQFKSKYKSLPGDSSYFSPPGNNDDRVSGFSTCNTDPANSDYTLDERLYFWSHLSQSGNLSYEYVRYSPDRWVVRMIMIQKWSHWLV